MKVIIQNATYGDRGARIELTDVLSITNDPNNKAIRISTRHGEPLGLDTADFAVRCVPDYREVKDVDMTVKLCKPNMGYGGLTLKALMVELDAEYCEQRQVVVSD